MFSKQSILRRSYESDIREQEDPKSWSVLLCLLACFVRPEEAAAVGRGGLEVTELSEITDGVKVFRVVIVVVPHDTLQGVRRQEAERRRGRREPTLGEVAADLEEQVIPRELLVQTGRV